MTGSVTHMPLLRLEPQRLARIARVCDKAVLLGLFLLAIGIPFADIFEVFFYGGQLLAVGGLIARIAVCEKRSFWARMVAQFLAVVVFVFLLAALFSASAAPKVLSEFLIQCGFVVFIWLVALQGRLADESSDEEAFSTYRIAQIAFAGFILVAIISSVLSLSPEASFRDFRKELGPYAIVYLVVVRSVRNVEYLKKIVRILFIVGLIVAFVGIAEYAVYKRGDFRLKQYFLRTDMVRAERPGELKSPIRIQFPFGHHNRMASYMMLTTAIVLLQWTLTVGRGNRRWTAVALAAPLVAMALTWNRGAIIGLAAGVTVFALFTRPRYIVYGVLCLLFAYILLPAAMKEHYATMISAKLYTSDDGTVAARKHGWRAAVAMVADHPFFGIGFGWRNFEKVYPQYRERSEIELKPHSHNNFLEIAAETGLVGLGFFVIFSAILLAALAKRCLAQMRDSPLRFTAAAFLALLVAAHTFGLSNYSLRRTIGFLVWMVFGLSLAYLRLYGARYLVEDECSAAESAAGREAG